jgi:hypothetical protein
MDLTSIEESRRELLYRVGSSEEKRGRGDGCMAPLITYAGHAFSCEPSLTLIFVESRYSYLAVDRLVNAIYNRLV